MTTYTENEHRELALLEHISVDPDATQATLATQLGVAVGTINWHLKRLIDKGYVKVRRAERRKLRYIITPEGIALRARLAIDYIQTSMSLYRLVRERSLKAIQLPIPIRRPNSTINGLLWSYRFQDYWLDNYHPIL